MPKDSFEDALNAFFKPRTASASESVDQVWIITLKNFSYKAQCVEGGGRDWNLYGPIEMIKFRLAKLGCKRVADFPQEPDRGFAIERTMEKWVKPK